ncbi:hypothetical protein N8T08_003098 [Aspergillus melleus]|uniref:Uncharacterized protein n=1 Tax=Aspergillus melleus TaxID=138277 RepID=A0ACC3B7I7_9EURO|nr:hypothetical protein N8T08_003098 [Aspergillus melleus]
MEETGVEGVKGNSNAASDSLFQGKHFWLSQNIPQRSRFKETIEQNGGIIRLFEKDAEIKLVDHMKRNRNLSADTFSYRLVEDSVRKGRLQNLEDYRCGPSTSRPVGATNIRSRGHKILYTLQDDQALWDWMQSYEDDPNAPIRGDIPARKRRATGSPGSNAKTPTPEVPQQRRQKPPPPPKFILPTPNKNITNKRNNVKGKGSEKPREREPEREPEPERESEQEPEKAPEQPPQQTPEQKRQSPSPVNEVYEPEPIDETFLELPFLPSSPGSSEPEEQPEQDIDAWIDDRLRTGIAKTEDQIIEALRCTSMDPQLADQVLKHLVAGKDIPKDMPGVWTAEDDKCIEGRDTRDIEKVLEKHGSEFFNSRWQYLDMARTAGLEKGQEEGITEL